MHDIEVMYSVLSTFYHKRKRERSNIQVDMLGLQEEMNRIHRLVSALFRDRVREIEPYSHANYDGILKSL
jgi:hypothetical protein